MMEAERFVQKNEISQGQKFPLRPMDRSSDASIGIVAKWLVRRPCGWRPSQRRSCRAKRRMSCKTWPLIKNADHRLVLVLE